jgi:minor extracellular protease Epr
MCAGVHNPAKSGFAGGSGFAAAVPRFRTLNVTGNLLNFENGCGIITPANFKGGKSMKKFLSLVLALVMTMSLVVVGASAKDFTDSSKINYKEAVDVIAACKIIDGYTDGSFNPAATLTRGAAAKIICNMMLGPTTAAALGV